jgi:hypothetical protein
MEGGMPRGLGTHAKCRVLLPGRDPTRSWAGSKGEVAKKIPEQRDLRKPHCMPAGKIAETESGKKGHNTTPVQFRTHSESDVHGDTIQDGDIGRRQSS